MILGGKMINAIFEELASDNSRLFKLEILEKHKYNKDLKRAIKLALDPFTQFYIRKIPKYTPNNGEGISLSFALDTLNDLSMRHVTGNAAIAHLTSTLEALTFADAKVIERVIQKDLKCGVSVATANAVWTGLVSEYPVMLCSQYDAKNVAKISFPAYAQMKMDGMRFNAIVHNGKLELRSRNGKEINLLGNLEKQFVELAQGVDCVFDGELMVMHTDDYQFADRQTGNGILNKAVKGTISSEEAKMVHASLWDVIPLDQFKQGKCNIPYSTRFSSLETLVSKQSGAKRIWIVTSQIVPTLQAAQDIFEEYLASGYEGIILKDGSGIWENKRAKHQIKFKGELDCDLKIDAIEEGTGKYIGRLGALVCSSRLENGKQITVNVGSGFNDADRNYLWSIRDSLIGKVVAVKYNARIKNKQGEESLFLPIFLEVREDKDEADLPSRIK